MWLRREAKLKKHSLDPIETSCRLVRHDHLDSLADDEQALLEHFDLVLPREVLRSVLELFLERDQIRGGEDQSRRRTDAARACRAYQGRLDRSQLLLGLGFVHRSAKEEESK